MLFTTTAPEEARVPTPRSALPRAASMDSPSPAKRASVRRSYDEPTRSLSFPLRPESAGSSFDSVRRVRFEEEDEEVESDGMSAFSSPSADTFAPSRAPGSGARRTPPRSKTSYQIAHPPPGASARHKTWSRLLLQLQRLSTSSRAQPALDVLPSSACPRAQRRLAKRSNCKIGTGPNTIAVVRSEEYSKPSERRSSAESESSDSEGSETRDLVAFICPMGRAEGGALGKARIHFSDGDVWDATPLKQNKYEFLHLDTHGQKTIARWIPRTASKQQKPGNAQEGLDQTTRNDRRFNFSLINPNTRRHPVIASMDRQNIRVLDYYRNPNGPSSPTIISTPSSPSVAADNAPYFGLTALETTLTVTDDKLRNLILVTGIWVAFRENWSQNFKYDDPIALKQSPTRPQLPRPASLPAGGIKQLQYEAGELHHQFHHMGNKILRSGSQILHKQVSAPGKAGPPVLVSPHTPGAEVEAAPLPSVQQHALPHLQAPNKQPKEEPSWDSQGINSGDMHEKGVQRSHGGRSSKTASDLPEKTTKKSAKKGKWTTVFEAVMKNTCGHR